MGPGAELTGRKVSDGAGVQLVVVEEGVEAPEADGRLHEVRDAVRQHTQRERQVVDEGQRHESDLRTQRAVTGSQRVDREGDHCVLKHRPNTCC